MTEGITMTDIEREITPDIVAARCQSYEFAGKPLSPMTKTRQVAARCMDHYLFQGKATADERGVYPEMFRDALIIVWLCSVDEARARRACLKPNDALDEMLQWWEANGGDLGSTREAEMVQIYGSIIEDLVTVSAQVDATGSKSGGEALGE